MSKFDQEAFRIQLHGAVSGVEMCFKMLDRIVAAHIRALESRMPQTLKFRRYAKLPEPKEVNNE